MKELCKKYKVVFLVEDELGLRRVIRQLLEGAHYKVVEASSGETARSIWHEEKERFDLLLIDLILPDGIRGKELAEEFRKEKPGLKTIYTSGYDLEQTCLVQKPGGGTDFIQKPFAAVELLHKIKRLLDQP